MRRSRSARVALIVLGWLAIVPAAAYAQASITGVVRDTSGAVLPGVTVEAASPALIEKVRSVVTDNSGQYRIENLRPGTYSVTVTLPGFRTFKREGIELTGTFTASVNAELRVGTVEETITVTGETPVVDVQSTNRQQVLNKEIIDAIPSGRNAASLAGFLPGVSIANQDPGGLSGEGSGTSGAVTAHGNSEVRTLVNGVSVASGSGSGNTGASNIAAYQEMDVDISGISAEQKEGGVRMNLIPREGGNSFAGVMYVGYANPSMQGSNLSQALQDRGLRTSNGLKKYQDLNPSFGGPIKRDRVWFYATARSNRIATFAPIFYNKNAGNPNAWTYEPDTSREAASNESNFKGGNARITWQATPKHKLAVAYDYQNICNCPRNLTASITPEANVRNHAILQPKDMWFGDWTAPLTNRLLLEARVMKSREHAYRPVNNLYFTNDPGGVKLNGVVEQSTGLTYRGAVGDNRNTWLPTQVYRANMSYITGAHALKIGFNLGFNGLHQQIFSTDSAMSFQFNNGVPNRLTLDSTPWRRDATSSDHGAFVQDKWTTKRLTVTAGLRYDYFAVHFPAATMGPGEFLPNRNLSFPKAEGVRWNDLQPRSGVAYDLFGDGKTALKASMNKYLPFYGLQLAVGTDAGTFSTNMAPVARLVTSTNRSWSDANRNFVPDCDLIDPVANGECGAMSPSNFGSAQPGVAYDPDIIRGWGKREYNWQFSAGVQHELLPRVSLDVGYYGTWYNNLFVTDNRAWTAADFDTFSLTAPSDPRLPGGGGYTVPGLYNIKPEKFSVPADNYITFAKNYGKQIRRWDGVDITVNARPRPGLMFQGGTSSGRTTTDVCDIVDDLPEMLLGAKNVGDLNPNVWLSASDCRQRSRILTDLKLLGTYIVPRIDVQVAATVQSVPGPQIVANYVAANAVVQPSLGRPLSGNAANMTANIVDAGTMYGERSNQMQLRVAKLLRLGRTHATASLDVYNVFNANPVLTLNSAFATWQRPLSIPNARWAKFVLQFEF
jgi:carboxypeptidase family protein